VKRRRSEEDPEEMLRRADPLDGLNVPTDTTGDHARSLFQEVVNMEGENSLRGEQGSAGAKRRWAVPAAAAAAIAALVIVGISTLGGNGTTPDDQPLAGGIPIATAAMCVEFYDLDTLGNREVAFDGTLTDINGSDVTFSVGTWFRGGSEATATLDENGLTGITSLGGPRLEVGRRYLVSGSGGFVWGCGFTMTYDSAIATQWFDNLGG